MSDWTPLSLIQWTAGFFEKKGIPNPRLDAELLLAHVLKCKRLDLYMQFEKIISEQDRTHYKTLIERRATREPLQYIIGETEFWGLKIQVTPDVLIPRPETELLVEEVIKIGGKNILEIGTGSGCISIALAKNIPEAKIIATDISPKALTVAKMNIEKHELQEKIQLLEADIAPWKTFESEGTMFDLIVSNPPYIPEGELTSLQIEVRDHEPQSALISGPEGLTCIEKIISESSPFLKPEGFLFLEVGEHQGKILKEKYQNSPTLRWFKKIPDYQNIERIVVFQK